MTDTVVTLRLSADGSVLSAAAQKAGRDVAAIGDQAGIAGRRVADGLRQGAGGAGALSQSLGGLRSTLAGLATVATAAWAARAADDMSNLAARIGLVSESSREMIAGQEAVVRIAQETGSSVQATGTLFVRLGQALKDAGSSQREVADLTETVSKAMAVSGASTEEASGAIVQLSQAFASGTLRGDEFNSVNEAAPRIMEALAKSLGVSRGELRALAEQGNLTSDALRMALSGEQAQAIAGEFSKLPLTIGRAWQQLVNSVTVAVGKISQDSGGFALVAGAISAIAKAIDFLTPRLIAWGALWAETFRDAYATVVDLATSGGNALLQFFADLTGATRDAATTLRDDLGSAFEKAAQDSWREIQILPVSLSTVFAVMIGEADKLRIAAIEKFKQLVVAGEQAWLSLRSATATLANDMRTVIGSALDAIISGYARLVGSVGDMAAKAGLDSLASRLQSTSAALLGMADSEAKARAAAEASRATYAAESVELAQRSAAIAQAASLQRAAADSAIQAALDERTEALAALDVQKETVELSDRAGESKRKLGDETEKAGTKAKKAAAHYGEWADAIRAAYDAERQLVTMVSRLGDDNDDLRAEIDGASRAQIAYNQAVRDAQREFRKVLNLGPPTAEAMAAVGDAIAAAGERLQETQIADLVSQFGQKSDYDQIVENIGLVEEALNDAIGEGAVEKVEALRRTLAGMNQQLEQHNIALLQQGVSSLQRFTKEGTAAYTALGIAQDVLAYKSAIAAIANQGAGDPYTAFARIAAMIALMASIGIRIAGGGGSNKPSAQSAEVRQEAQGTGSVLGDPSAKSESIANAIEITAKATEQLVGISRGMLSALLDLKQALGAAGGMLARGAGDADFPGLQTQQYGLLGPAGQFDPLLNAMTGGYDPLGNAIGSFLWGGSQKVIDEGIVIMGGALADMIEQIAVGAYRTIETDGGLFGSDSTGDQLGEVSDGFARQFQLVISSIADTVRAGATALGLLPADIEARLAAFRVEEIRISLKGLSAEEQQKEIEAVFSKIFDDLAGSVVPFIGQFQQVGEGLGETLVRVATEVQVTQEAIKQLGIVIDETDPERFAQISDGLIQAAGGLDAFIDGMNSFMSNFSTDANRLQVASEALASAFAQVGLTVPSTRQGMFDLMQTLDATTEAGREQIATLLRLSDTADAYYSAVEKKVKEAAEYLQGLGVAGFGLSSFQNALQSIRESEHKAIDAANLLAVAHGREGASAVQLAQIHDWASKQIAAALRRLQAETRDLIAKLYGGIPGTLEAINAQISALEGAGGGDAASQISDAQQASNELFESWKSGIKSVQDYLDSMLIGDLSALSPEEQLAEAKRQLVAAQQAALQGDAQALSKLPQMADAFLRIERQYDASGADYNAQFDWVRQLLGSVSGLPNPGTQASDPIAVAVSASPELQALYAARDAALAAQENDYRANLAQQLAQNLHDLAVATSTPILQMIGLQGVALDRLATDMGVNLSDLTGQSVLALGNMATTLGLSLTELTGALGLSLTNLSGGVTELTQRLGIDLGNLTVQSTQTLAELANSLGADLSDLAQSVGIDLGSLVDRQSLLNEALAATINELPDDTRDQLAPLLEAITNATTEADANSAIHALEDAINLLAPDLRAQLAPYLGGVTPPDALTEIDYLSQLQDIGHDQLDVLRDIARGLDVPGYAIGTGYVPQTGLATIHQGEAILPTPVAGWLRANGFPLAQSGGGAANDGALLAEVRTLGLKVDALMRATTQGSDKIADSLRTGEARAQAQRDEIARNTRGGLNRSVYG